MIKINSSYKYLLFFFALIALISFSEISNSQETRSPACAATIPVADSLCETQPTTQKITIYKVAFCTAVPTVPTSTTATGMTNCTTVFENTAGSIVTIQKGIGTTPDGTFTNPPYGNYTYAYVELSPVLTYKASLVFNDTKALSSLTALNTGGGFSTCWTNGTNNFYWDTLRGITCGNGLLGSPAPDPKDTTNTINSLDNSLALYDGTLTEGTNSGTTHIYLIQSNGTLASGSASGAVAANANAVAKLIFFMPMTANITPDTTSYNLLYNNSRGMVVWLNNNGPLVGGQPTPNGSFNIGFNAAYFDMTFQIK
jgi:hypothetical protein